MTTETIEATGQAAIVDLVDALNKLAALHGLSLHITVMKDEGEQDDFAGRSRELLEQQRRDYAWFQMLLTTDQSVAATLRGNYVAVSQEEIISVGPDEDITRLGAANQLGLDLDQVLVLPVQVPGSDEYWEEIKHALAMD